MIDHYAASRDALAAAEEAHSTALSAARDARDRAHKAAAREDSCFAALDAARNARDDAYRAYWSMK